MVEGAVQREHGRYGGLTRLPRAVEQHVVGGGAEEAMLPRVGLDGEGPGKRHAVQGELEIVPKLYRRPHSLCP
jgi:hypothetical protein